LVALIIAICWPSSGGQQRLSPACLSALNELRAQGLDGGCHGDIINKIADSDNDGDLFLDRRRRGSAPPTRREIVSESGDDLRASAW
jgi:hypothetical protein